MTATGIRADPAASGRIVSVAVDAAGAAGQRPFSYRVPEALSDLAAGEAVLVEFGRRQALAIVLGPGAEVEGIDTKPVLDRIRADGPLLPELSMRLGAWISDHYLAPPAITLRAMLPPGLLERLELVAELRPGGDGNGTDQADAGADASAANGASGGADGLSAEDRAIVAALETGPRQVRQLAASEGRPALLRRLRSLEASGRVDLDWTLLAAAAGPRWVRFARLLGERGDAPTSARRLGPRQEAALQELATAAPEGIPAPELAARHGGSTLSSLVRRGLV